MERPRFSQERQARHNVSTPEPVQQHHRANVWEDTQSQPRSEVERVELPSIKTLLNARPLSQDRVESAISPGTSLPTPEFSLSPSRKRRRLSNDDGSEARRYVAPRIYDSPIRSPRSVNSALPGHPLPAIRSPSVESRPLIERTDSAARPTLPSLSSLTAERPPSHTASPVSQTSSRPAWSEHQGRYGSEIPAERPTLVIPASAQSSSYASPQSAHAARPNSFSGTSTQAQAPFSQRSHSGPTGSGWPSQSPTQQYAERSPFSNNHVSPPSRSIATFAPVLREEARGSYPPNYAPGYAQPHGYSASHGAPVRYAANGGYHGTYAPGYGYGHGYNGMPGYDMGSMSIGKQRKRRGNLPKETTEKLRNWFMAHLPRPYPTEEQKQELMRATGLQMNQISNWFINARRRQMPALMKNAKAETDARSSVGAYSDSKNGGSASASMLGSDDGSDVDGADRESLDGATDDATRTTHERKAYDDYELARMRGFDNRSELKRGSV